MELKATRFEVDDALATVWLHRPHRNNAWTGRMHAEYRHLMARVEADRSIRAVVVTGTGRSFCVGGDSEALAGHAARGQYDSGLAGEVPVPVADAPEWLVGDFAFQWAMRVPVIAAVNGAAAGVGLAVALWADLRFGAEAAKVTTAAPKLGLPAEYGMSWVLPRLVGVSRANDLLLSGRVVTVAETADWGLWNGVLDDGEAALGAAQAYARDLAATTAAGAVAMAKRQLAHDVVHSDPASSIAESLRLIAQSTSTDEYREGVAALRERRPPLF